MSATGKKKTIKNTNIWRLNNILLNNQQITEEIKICIEANENENTSQSLWDTVKAVLRGKFIAIQAYLKKQEKSQINNLCWIMEKAREFQKNIYFCFIDYAKAFDCVDHKKLWKILKEMGIPDHLICLLRNLYAGQEATVRTGHGPTDWFQLEKEYVRAVYCHPVYLTYMQSTS